jgi:hypothetical protein
MLRLALLRHCYFGDSFSLSDPWSVAIPAHGKHPPGARGAGASADHRHQRVLAERFMKFVVKRIMVYLLGMLFVPVQLPNSNLVLWTKWSTPAKELKVLPREEAKRLHTTNLSESNLLGNEVSDDVVYGFYDDSFLCHANIEGIDIFSQIRATFRKVRHAY